MRATCVGLYFCHPQACHKKPYMPEYALNTDRNM
jgi:hypothetical protein